MTGGPASHSQPREPDHPRPPSVHVNAVDLFASDPNGEPIEFSDDQDGNEPIDNLAAPVGILTAVAVGLLLWVVILVVFLWIK